MSRHPLLLVLLVSLLLLSAVVRVAVAVSSPPASISPVVSGFIDSAAQVDQPHLQALVLGTDALYIAAASESTTAAVDAQAQRKHTKNETNKQTKR